MAAGAQRPRGVASDFDYWLRRCEGFRVDSPQGRVGFVEELRYASSCDRPDAIAVRVGVLSRLLLVVSVGEVAEIIPRDQRVVLYRSPRPTATERLKTWRGHVQRGDASRAASTQVQSVAEETKREAEVKALIERLTRRIGLRVGRGGEQEMTSDVEASAEPSAEEPSAEEQTGEEPAAEETAEEEAGEEQATA